MSDTVHEKPVDGTGADAPVLLARPARPDVRSRLVSLPVVLFACVHNGGRSLATKVLAEHHAQGRVVVRSAGSEPGDALNPAVVQVLHERGLSTAGEAPTLLTPDTVAQADVVVTMGCGETCPVFPGTSYEDWSLDDPKGQDLDTVRRIVDEVDARVQDLLARVGMTGLGTSRGR